MTVIIPLEESEPVNNYLNFRLFFTDYLVILHSWSLFMSHLNSVLIHLYLEPSIHCKVIWIWSNIYTTKRSLCTQLHWLTMVVDSQYHFCKRQKSRNMNIKHLSEVLKSKYHIYINYHCNLVSDKYLCRTSWPPPPRPFLAIRAWSQMKERILALVSAASTLSCWAQIGLWCDLF